MKIYKITAYTLLILAGLVLFSIFHFLFFEHQVLVFLGARTEGKIIEIYEGQECTKQGCRPVYIPIISYTPPQSASVTFVPKFHKSKRITTFRVGNTLQLVYNPQFPRQVVINDRDFVIAEIGMALGLGIFITWCARYFLRLDLYSTD